MNGWFVCMSEIVLFGISFRFGTRYSLEISSSGMHMASLMSG